MIIKFEKIINNVSRQQLTKEWIMKNLQFESFIIFTENKQTSFITKCN